jgi:glycerophosphoryl diester phosphodiesterase
MLFKESLKKITFYFTILMIILSCSKEEFNINNLNGNRISAFGHAGMGNRSTYPINSYESLSKCLNFGADGTELDVQMTKDSILIAFHDENLASSTNISGLVHSLNWAEIKNARYTNINYANYSIITLDQLFSNTKYLYAYDFTFDVKLYPGNNNVNKYYNTYVNQIDKIIGKYNLLNNTFIESHNEDFLKLLQEKNSSYKLFINPVSFENGLETAKKMNLFGITISTENITNNQIDIAHDNNLFVAIWSIHSTKGNKNGIRKNPDFIQTDKIKNLIDLLD